MEVRDEIRCLVAHPHLPLLAFSTSVSTSNVNVDQSVMCSHIKVWNYERRCFVGEVSESGIVQSLDFSANGQILAIARSGDNKLTTVTDVSPHRIALYLLDQGFQLQKTDVSVQPEEAFHGGNINTICFCSVNLDAGAGVSWDGSSLNYFNDMKREMMRKPWMLKNVNQRVRTQSQVLHILASGGEDGVLRLWDYVNDKHIIIDVETSGVLKNVINKLTFSTDGRVLSALVNNTHLCMWSFSRSRPRLPKLDRDVLEKRLQEDYDRRVSTEEEQARSKGAKTRTKIELGVEQEQEFAKIASFARSVKDIPLPPTLRIGHPNLFMCLKLRKHVQEKKTWNSVTVVPGFSHPTAFPMKAGKAFLDEHPPAYPNCELDTRDVVAMYKRLQHGDQFQALFLIDEEDMIKKTTIVDVGTNVKNMTLNQQREYYKLLEDSKRKEELERKEEERKEEELAKNTRKMIRDGEALAEMREAGPQTISGDKKGTKIFNINVFLEYLEPLPYPAEAIQQVRGYNLQRYKFMLEAGEADLPEGYELPRSTAVLDPVKFPEEYDPRWKEEHRILSEKGAAPQERIYDVLGYVLIRDDMREYLFPQASLEQVQIGKFSVEHTSTLMSHIPSAQCFSQIGKDDQLHLIAPSPEIAAEWQHTLRHVFWKAGRNLACAPNADQFYVDLAPAAYFLDLDLVDALNAGVSMGLWQLMGESRKDLETFKRKKPTRFQHKTMLSENIKTSWAELSDDDDQDEVNKDEEAFYFGLDFLNNIFAATCHTYRLYVGGENYSGLLEVRVNHDAVFEYYCLDNKNPTEIATANPSAYTSFLVENGQNRFVTDIFSIQLPSVALHPLHLDAKKLLQTDDIGNSSMYLWDLLTVAYGQHKKEHCGDWFWLSSLPRSKCEDIHSSCATFDGRFIIAAEEENLDKQGSATALTAENGVLSATAYDDQTEEELLKFLNLPEADLATFTFSSNEKNLQRDNNTDESGNGVNTHVSQHIRHVVAQYKIAEGSLMRHVIGSHFTNVTAVSAIPPALTSKSGCHPSNDYVIVSGSSDETVQYRGFNSTMVTSGSSIESKPVQVVERPFFLSLMVKQPALAQQGLGPEYYDSNNTPTTNVAAHGKAAELISETKKKYEEALAMRRKKALYEAAEKAIHGSATLSINPQASLSQAGESMKLLEKIINIKQNEK